MVTGALQWTAASLTVLMLSGVVVFVSFGLTSSALFVSAVARWKRTWLDGDRGTIKKYVDQLRNSWAAGA